MKNLAILSSLQEAIQLSRDQTGQYLDSVMVNNNVGYAILSSSSRYIRVEDGYDYKLFLLY